MYQALLTNQTSQGVYGILSGLGLGLVVLSVLALLIRFASLKLPLQTFFKYNGEGGCEMKEIVVISGKGGTGKTTIATNLACLRAKQDKDVLIVDTDPQGSASFWCGVRDEESISPKIYAIQKIGVTTQQV